MIRTFIASDLPDDVRAALGVAQARLQQAHFGVKIAWTKMENAHLTLQFLGAIESAAVAGISQSLAIVAGNFPAFDVPVAGA